MSDAQKLPKQLARFLEGLSPSQPLFFDDSDHAYALLHDLNFELQWFATKALLFHLQEMEDAEDSKIDAIDKECRNATGQRNEWLADHWVDSVHRSVYTNAARSMAAVGALAPFIESLFHQTYLAIGRLNASHGIPPGKHPRWTEAQTEMWDCHFVWEKGHRGKNLVGGIVQLADATGMRGELPEDLESTLKALFHYRNRMFHLGYEWPVDERQRFARTISQEKWPKGWFQTAKHGEDPWVYYMSKDFIVHCVETVEKSIAGIGRFVAAKHST